MRVPGIAGADHPGLVHGGHRVVIDLEAAQAGDVFLVAVAPHRDDAEGAGVVGGLEMQLAGRDFEAAQQPFRGSATCAGPDPRQEQVVLP